MYLPDAFAERDPGRLAGFLASFPLGLLVTPGPGPDAGVNANLLPFEYLPPLQPDAQGGGGVLRAHVARSNPLWVDAANAAVLVVFQGPQAYVSPSLYPSKSTHGKVVPTWNYAMVQARGQLRVVDDAEWLRAQVRALTTRHEAALPSPWSPEDAPAEYIDTMLRALVGIEIAVSELMGKWKLSQNRSTEDLRAVRDAVRGADARSMAGLSKAEVSKAEVSKAEVSMAEVWMAEVMDAHLRERGEGA